MILRDYQADFVHRIAEALRVHQWVVAQAPTGAGKTRVIAYVAKGALTKSNRIVIVAHRKRLCQQISDTLAALGVPHGRIQSGHPYEPEKGVQVGMVQTVKNRMGTLKPPTLLVVDETHHIMSNSYLSLLRSWKPKFLLGLTATPSRLDGKGLGEVFRGIVQGPQVRDLIKAGWLAQPLHIAPPPKMDLSNVRSLAGDYVQRELADAMNKAVITGDAVEQYRKHLAGRTALVFSVTLDHGRSVADTFAAAGYRSDLVSGNQPEDTQVALMDALGDGRLDVLVSCRLVDEGVDIPTIGGIIMLRPTQSVTVHLQQCGRALRPNADGSHAVILDLVGNYKRHGLADDHRTWTLEKTQTKSSVSQCPVCFKVFSTTEAAWRQSGACMFDAPPPDCTLSQKPAVAASRALPEVVDGPLAVITRTPPWAMGLNILEAKRRDWYRLLDLADTPQKLQEIAHARRYRHGWVVKIWQAKLSRMRGHG